jgi:ribose transport system permease protein
MIKIKQFFRKNKITLIAYAVALLIFTVISIIKPGFGSISHIRIILIDAAILGIVALGQTVVIITGGIDLSIPWLLNCASVFIVMFSANQNKNLIFAIPLILLFTTVVGLINGLAISYLGIPPIIMTLGMNSILLGALLVIWWSVGAVTQMTPGPLHYMAEGSVIGGIPVILFVWVLLIVVISIILSQTRLGRFFYTIGNNEKVALFSGINIRFIKIIAYCISGFTAGLAGIFLVGRTGQAYLGMGDIYLFPSVIVVVLGGASIMGGSGSYIGTVAGVLTLIIINGLLPVFNMSAGGQQILYGLILLFAVLINRAADTRRVIT